jgi:hypothetical protein
MRCCRFLKVTLAAVILSQSLALEIVATEISNRSDGVTNTIEYERFRWSFDRRATLKGIIPEGARLKALETVKRERMKRNRTEGRTASLSDFEALQGDHWTSIGPAPILNGQTIPPSPVSGRIASIAVNPTNSRHWLIGAAQGGVWETRDAGSSWLPRTDDQASLAIGAVVFAPSTPNIIFAGTGEGVASAD